jgi:hypothetical protein
MAQLPSEIGFWDYTCPGHGSLEGYSVEDWDLLLDDMQAGGFNSLVLGVKWLTTGYRSQYAWLDQKPGVATIESDNATLLHALRGARQRGMRTWLLVVGSIFDVEAFGFAPASAAEGATGSLSYDLYQPGVLERILKLYREVAEIFGAEADGMVVELEFCDSEAPHRVPLYDAWAKENGRMAFADIKKLPLEPRGYPQFDWRDFTTSRRIDVLRQIETAIRETGFTGKVANLVEMVTGPGLTIRNVNLDMLRAAFPNWPIVTYDHGYNRKVNRASTREFAMEEPLALGFEVYYLTRGVMTFNWPADLPALNLEEQWRMSLEDAKLAGPHALWFMGSDAHGEGMVVNETTLPEWGFADGRTARLRLMEMVREALG